MRKLLFTLVALFLGYSISAQTTDSVDVLKYRICLDVDHQVSQAFVGYTDIQLKALQPLVSVPLDLKHATVDSVLVDGVAATNISYDSLTLTVNLPSAAATGDTLTIRVFYQSNGYVENYGMGGFHFSGNIIYNLGAVFEESPHTFGRAWYPCRDVFADKATYQYAITVSKEWEAVCSGMPDSVSAFAADSSRTFHYSVSHPISTYLSSVTIGNFNVYGKNLNSLYGNYPLSVRYTSGDSASIANTFAILDTVFPMYERCFGPYLWGRVGYVGTPRGSMEHVANISLIGQCINDRSTLCQMVVCHELSHAWFGNLVTCETQADMWFNEGGASFCEEVAMEAAFGKEAADEYYNNNLETVIRTLHHTDTTYHAIANIPDMLTYSGTVYNKGAAVIHSLRGYLGDSLFYASMRTLFNNNRFGSLNSAQIRDSLSLYSGVDLTDFFNFHVFGPGFTHFSIDSMRVEGTSATVFMRQKLVGATQFANGNRVPVTFFSDTWDSITKIMTFDGQFGQQTFSLPFAPKFAIVDLYNDLSDAISAGSAVIKAGNSLQFPGTYFVERNFTSSDSSFFHLSHNWVAPDGMKNPDPAIKRLANRYWKIDGDIRTRIMGKFAFKRYNQSSASSAYLDENFLEDAASIDSLVLLYRPNTASDWQYEESTREGSTTSGYLSVTRIKAGEYTLAIADTANIRTNLHNTTLDGNVRIYPNPASKKVTVEFPELKQSCDIAIFSISGAKVLEQKDIRSGSNVDICGLADGTYTIRIATVDGKSVFTDKLIVK